MQTIYQNENERKDSEKADKMNFVIYTEIISKCLKGEYTGRFEIRRLGISISRRFVGSIKEKV